MSKFHTDAQFVIEKLPKSVPKINNMINANLASKLKYWLEDLRM